VRKSLKNKRDEQVFNWQFAELERFTELNKQDYLDCKLHSKIFEGTLNSEKIIATIDEFVQHIRKQTILVIDNARVHHSKMFKEKIKEWHEQDLYVYFLPKYSPELNKIEILWRFIKYSWLPLDAYKNIQNIKERLNEILLNVGGKYYINFF
jgi:transposase